MTLNPNDLPAFYADIVDTTSTTYNHAVYSSESGKCLALCKENHSTLAEYMDCPVASNWVLMRQLTVDSATHTTPEESGPLSVDERREDA